ncbi:MAG: hypothetical protein QGD96_12850 [Anaerolineae bacterium]|nr:hypothetical protein [Anaerolineae bacterium]
MLLASASSFAAESYFSSVKLPRGVEVQVPKGWWLLGKDYNRIIQTSVEAAMDLSGIGLDDGEEVNLIAANSMPRTTYAALRIDSTIPPSATPKEIINISKSELRELSSYMEQEFHKLLPLQGNRLLNFYGVHVERISGHPALVTRYRRSGPKGPVIVEINQIYPGGIHELRMNLSYRESEKALWLAVVKKIRSTIKIK